MDMDEVIMEPLITDDMEIEPFDDHKPNGENTKEDLDLVLSEGETNLEPYEGMEFESEEAARSFYAAYARHVGFRIRISRYTRSRRDNTIISRLIVCSKEGFRESRGNDGVFGERRPQRQRAITRIGCKAMLMLKKLASEKWVVSKFVKEHNHGPVPPRKLEVRVVQKEEDLVERSNFSSDGVEIHEPLEGMEFDSEEDARTFYINYARQMGFRARISKYCRSRRDNSIISRQIVCSKEGFREARIKKEEMEDGRVKRPRVVTRIGCKAMIIVKRLNSGKWVVSRFEKEHNHALVALTNEPQLLQSSNDSDDKSLVAYIGEANVISNGTSVIGNGCSGENQGTSRESLTVLYNRLCYESVKYAQEGAVSEEIYNVAMSALKEAAEKVAAAKRSAPTGAHQGEQGGNIVQCSSEAKKVAPEQEVEYVQQPFKFVLIPSTTFANDSKIANNSVESPIILNVPNDQRMSSPNAASVLRQSSADTKSVDRLDGSDTVVQASAVQNSQGVGQAKANLGSDNMISKVVSESQMVALPALPVTVYMPVMGSLSESSSVAAPDASSNNAYVVAAQVEALPVTCKTPESTARAKIQTPYQSYPGPNPLVHATAIAAGARIVPPHEAASLIKAIEARVHSMKSGFKQLSATELLNSRTLNNTEKDPKTLPVVQTHEEVMSSEEMRAKEAQEALKDLDANLMDNSSLYDSACEDHHLFSDGGS